MDKIKELFCLFLEKRSIRHQIASGQCNLRTSLSIKRYCPLQKSLALITERESGEFFPLGKRTFQNGTFCKRQTYIGQIAQMLSSAIATKRAVTLMPGRARCELFKTNFVKQEIPTANISAYLRRGENS